VLGAGAMLALRQTIESQLYGITALNVPALAIAAVSLIGAACLASLMPAIRAVRIDPVRALKAD
jgi:ABC-type lipoprotein release transport system permease subunit